GGTGGTGWSPTLPSCETSADPGRHKSASGNARLGVRSREYECMKGPCRQRHVALLVITLVAFAVSACSGKQARRAGTAGSVTNSPATRPWSRATLPDVGDRQ